MTKIPGTNVAAPIVPFDTADTYPTHDSAFGIGGKVEVLTLNDRNTIPAERRRAGMVVTVTNDLIEENNGPWELLPDLVTWRDFHYRSSLLGAQAGIISGAEAGAEAGTTAAAPFAEQAKTAATQANDYASLAAAAADATSAAAIGPAVQRETKALLDEVTGVSVGQVGEVWGLNPDRGQYRWTGILWERQSDTLPQIQGRVDNLGSMIQTAEIVTNAVEVLDADRQVGLAVTDDFLGLSFGAGTIAGAADGDEITIQTRDGATTLGMRNNALSLDAVGLASDGGTDGEVYVGDEDGYYTLLVRPGQIVAPGMSVTPSAATVAGVYLGRDSQGNPALLDAAGNISVSVLPGGGFLLREQIEISDTGPSGIALGVYDADGLAYNQMREDGTWINGSVTPEPEPPAPDLAPLHGGNVYLLPDQPLPLYLPMLLSSRSDAARARITFSSSDVSLSGNSVVQIDPASVASTGLLTLARADISETTRTRLPLSISVASPSGQSPRILMIGDSITNRQQAQLVGQRLAAVGITAQWIGTVPGSASSTDAGNSAGPLGEAREGRAWGDLVYSVLDGEAAPLPVGQEAAYLALSKADKLAYNPFIRAATGGDSSAIIRNGYVWDLGFYLSRFSLATPDIMIINLGENDCAERGSLAAADVYDAATIVVAQARAAAPSMRIGLTMSGQGWTPGGDTRWSLKAACIRSIIRVAREASSSLVTVIPAWSHISPDEGWGPTSITTDPNSGIQTGTISDPIHPTGYARNQLAAAVAAYIACRI